MVDRMAMAIRVHQRKIEVNKNGASPQLAHTGGCAGLVGANVVKIFSHYVKRKESRK